MLYLAAVTSTVRLAVGVVVIPQRNPVLSAKQLTSLDVFSGGRLIVDVGMGHIEAELAALGVPMSERGLRAEEGLLGWLELWTSPQAGGDGAADHAVPQFPTPVHVPIPLTRRNARSCAVFVDRRGLGESDGTLRLESWQLGWLMVTANYPPHVQIDFVNRQQ